MKNLGFSRDVAEQIEDNYHEMYKVSDQWVQDKLDEAVPVTGFCRGGLRPPSTHTAPVQND